MKHIILSCVIFVQLYAGLQAQNIECTGNTITITLNDYIDGDIQWQFSNNNLDWTDLTGATETILTHNVVETGYYRAKVNYGKCEFFGDTEYIIAYQGPSIANAGADQNIITEDTVVTLEANTPTFGIGKWSIVSGGTGSFEDDTNPTTTFTGRKYVTYNLRWTITTDCKASTDNVLIIFYDPFNTLSDADGNKYTSVTIGTQKWMAENLKTTRYSNGDLIGTTTPPLLNIKDEVEPKYQWVYDDDENIASEYGRLYTWYAITDSRNVCPIGWHVPDNDEWTELSNYLGGESAAGPKLKETGTEHWISTNNNSNATNEFGFTALPGGIRSGSFYNMGRCAYFWASTPYSLSAHSYFFAIDIEYNESVFLTGASPNSDGMSVRCLKDE